MDTKKKAKKSKHGQKNWRKNIDVTAIEEKIAKKNKEEIVEAQVRDMKDNELFTLDYSKGNEKFSGKKRERPGKKRSVVELRKIKRMIENDKEKGTVKEETEEMNDLWEDEDVKRWSLRKKKVRSISYPVVPIPHPGQSYNPSKDDLSKLLYKVVELNKPYEKKIKEEEEKKNKEKAVQEYKYDDDNNEEEEEDSENENDDEDNEEEEEEEDDIPCTHPVSNNPPTLDNRLSRKDKRKKEQRKAHFLRVDRAIKKKQAKIDISNAKSTKAIEKERKKNQLQEAKMKLEAETKRQNLQSQYKHGIIDDKDLLEDFIAKKDPTPLRKMKGSHNYLSERFENIVKRNVIGKDSQKKKVNRKLHKVAYMDTTGSSYKQEDNEKLQIFN